MEKDTENESNVRKRENVPQKEDNDQNETDTEKKSPKATSGKYGIMGFIKVTVATLMTAFFILGFNLLCNKRSCWLSWKKWPTIPTRLSSYYDRDAVLLVLAYYTFQAVLACIPIGQVVQRPPMKGGKPTSFRCNGLLSLALTALALAGLIHFKYPVTIVYKKFIKLLTTSVVLAYLMAGFSYFGVRNLGNQDKNEPTGTTLSDWYRGRSLYPRIGPLDVKHFFFSRANITWALFNAVFVWKAQSEGHLDPTLTLVALFQALYIGDRLIFEDELPLTISYRELGYGFYIMAGSILAPFMFSLQCRFLLEHSVKWHYSYHIAFFVLNLIGYIIFRGSNSEKNQFRQNPDDAMFANFKTIPTSSGKKLLASGWWGMCRHPNYLGDLIIAISWVLPLGFKHAYIPSLYPLMLLPALLSQAHQDHQNCQRKYGEAWDRYCRQVKYVILPYVY